VTVQIAGLEFRYRDSDFFLRISDLTIAAGSRVAIIGPSGSGKTTLLNLICGVSVPSRGRVLLDDTEVTSLPDAARRFFRVRNIGMVFQEFELLEYLTVLDNILLPYRIGEGLRLSKDVREWAAALANQVGIGDKIGRHVERLSHGERQRVGICRALITQPRLVLADEPTGSLDPVNKGRILEILADYSARHGATLVAVTHDHELLAHFDRVVDFREFERAVAPEGVTA
jgi:putative ABC transport system ATP-binding protein